MPNKHRWRSGCLAVACVLTALRAGAAPSAPQIEQLLAEGKVDEAVTAARAAVKADDDDPDLHMALAQGLATQGRRVMSVVEAEIDPVAGLRTLPFPTPGVNTKIEIVYEQELLEEALAEVRKAIRLAPERTDLRYSECYLLTDAGLIQKAAAAIFRTLESFPGVPGLASTLASYGTERVVRGDPEGGATLLGVVATAFPEDAEVLAAFGTALAHAGRREDAFSKLDRAAKLGERDMTIQRKTGVVSLLFQDFDRAKTAYLRAHLLSHDTGDRFGVAVAQYGLEPISSRADFEELAWPSGIADPLANALARDFLRAIARPKTRIDLARKLVADQEGLLAIPVLSRVLREQPDNDDARTLMAEIYVAAGFPLPDR